MQIKMNKWAFLGLFVSSMTLTNCVNEEKDLYDPAFKTANPLEIKAPDGFKGETVSSAKVKVDVNDEYNGSYNYTVSIYDRYPTAKGANLLGTGVAKKGKAFETSINCLKGDTILYVEQTDPRGRKLVGTVDPRLTTSGTAYYGFGVAPTKALTRATTRSIAERPTYTVYTSQNIPANAIEITPETLIESNKSYKISGNYNATFITYGTSNSKLFVTGHWKFDTFKVETGLQIIVLPGAKIEANYIEFVNQSSLEVMNGGEVNLGTLHFANGNRLINLGKMTLGETKDNPGVFYNGPDAVLDITRSFMLGGALYYNDGKITANEMVTTWGAKFVNNCQLDVTHALQFREGQLELTKGGIRAETIEFNGNTVYLLNGSMLKASQMINMNSNTTIVNNTTARSLLKTPKIIFDTNNSGANNTYKGALTVEVDEHPQGDEWWSPYKLVNGATMTSYNGSDIVITTCAGTINDPSGGTDPQEPENDLVTKDKYTYTYAFEDQWPLYGDYDLNDFVVRTGDFRTVKTKVNAYEGIDTLSFTCRVMAVGATKILSLGAQLDGIDKSAVKSITFSTENGYLSPAQLGLDHFDHTGYLENGQTQAVIPLLYHVHNVFNQPLTQVNTIQTGALSAAKTFKVTIVFNSKAVKSFTLADNFNLFIITDNLVSQDRKEIHLMGKAPTNLASTRFFNNNNDRSTEKNSYYTSEDNLPWGFLMAQDTAFSEEENLWRWPLEYVSIKEAYGQFANWVTSGGAINERWFDTYSNNKVF